MGAGQARKFSRNGETHMNQIAEMLGIRYPVIQGAMNPISNPELVAAVSEAGGFGLLATGLKQPEVVQLEIQAVRQITDKPFGINIQTWTPISLKLAETVVEAGLPAVTLSAGAPAEVCAYLKPRGVKSFAVVPNVANAIKSEKAGVDAIIAEGTESGGVQGRNGVSTLVLVPMVVDEVSVPVIAAGGIGDARGFRAAMALGAKGVQVGTRFIASHECMAHLNVKKAVCQAKETDTLLFAQSERTFSRLLRTPLAEKLLDPSSAFERERLMSYPGKAWLEGDLDRGFVSVGQIAGMIKEIKPVRTIIEEMVT
jgi:enoyl-[acyl-carrier protein] reductase II